jgi:hypothetical protein
VWSVRFGEESAAVNDIDGMRYLAALLEKPGRYIPAATLSNLLQLGGPVRPLHHLDAAGPDWDAKRRRPPHSLPLVRSDELSTRSVAMQEVLDGEAVRDYRRRIGWLQDALATAGNPDRFDSLASEKRFIEKELHAARGFGGRTRPLDSTPQEKARQRVRQAIDYASDKIARSAPSLAHHLRESVRADSAAYAYLPVGPAPDWAL